MILIILSHIIFDTKSLPKLDKKNYKKIINNNYIFLRIISNNGKIGDIIFIMISGYFSVKRLDFHYYKFILIATETYTYHYLFLYISFKLIPYIKILHHYHKKKVQCIYHLILH
jgi:hypothetical protein